MNRKNTAARKYLKQTGRKLTCGMRQNHRLMSDLKRTIGIFLDDCPDASYEDFLEAFGSPAEMAAEMLRDVPEQEIAGVQRNRKWIRIALTACLAAVAVGACGTVAYFIRYPYTAEITTVIYEDEDHIPEYWKYAEKYGLSYEMDEEGNIISATDRDGNTVEIEQNGIPLDQLKYESADGTLSEETE